MKQLVQFGGGGLDHIYDGMADLMISLYPNHPWDQNKFADRNRVLRKDQTILYRQVCRIFPSEEVLLEFSESSLCHEHNGMPISLDVFVPALRLAFEYQGVQHTNLEESKGTFSSSETQRRKDISKATTCEKNGITLIEVPHWWDLRKEPIIGSIKAVRPDLLTEHPKYHPISKGQPSNYTKFFRTKLDISKRDIQPDQTSLAT
eukprot:TRINITY_DN8651_c0_g1_i2.p1 TRINITY_DN8651_c0_g1~~TRINITY_DN8651_c0_g1_i2.p1  ORF type:complete len:204 (+),score=25.24 TRINITY_DN8651_c0_g1_i2:617-1228(+)